VQQYFGTFLRHSKNLSLVNNTPKYFDNFYLIGNVFSNNFDFKNFQINGKIFAFIV